MTLAHIPLYLLLAGALICPPALADPAASDFDGQWGEIPAASPSEFDRAAPLIGNDTRSAKPERNNGLDLNVDGNTVEFGTVEGAPGARITPRSSKLSVGIGVAPAIGDDQVSPSEGFAALDDGFDGAFELKLNDGPLTPSMTLTGPLGDATTCEADGGGDFRTMFGLGYAF